MRISSPDPLSPVVALIMRGEPVTLAWAERWSAVWRDPVIGAWKASRDPSAMAVLIAAVQPREIQAVANAIWRPMLRKYVNDLPMIEREVRAALNRNALIHPGMMRWKVEEDLADRIRAFAHNIPTLGYVMRWNRRASK
jgi:hypothetical protein